MSGSGTVHSSLLEAIPGNAEQYRRARLNPDSKCVWKKATQGYETDCGFLWYPEYGDAQVDVVCRVCGRTVEGHHETDPYVVARLLQGIACIAKDLDLPNTPDLSSEKISETILYRLRDHAATNCSVCRIKHSDVDDLWKTASITFSVSR